MGQVRQRGRERFKMSKQDYLRRYMTKDPTKKRKRRKKKKNTGSVKIIDEDVNWYSAAASKKEAEVGEYAPMVVAMEESEGSSDMSVERQARHDTDDEGSPPRRVRHDSSSDSGDLSPPRQNAPASRPRVESSESDSDLSVERKGEPKKADALPQRSKTGLFSGSEFRAHAQRKKELEDAKLRKMKKKDTGEGAETVYRDKHGRKLSMLNEMIASTKGKKTATEEIAWGGGLKQKQEEAKRLEREAYLASKPLARYADDEDMNEEAQNEMRWDDPMKKLVAPRNRKRKRSKPKYKGPAPPPNRFGIPPGYRWDGVDRTNGFEKTWMAAKNDQKASEGARYAWSVSDM